MAANRIAHIGALLLGLQACAASSQQVEKIGIYDLSSERLSGPESVTAEGAGGFSQLEVLVTVGPDGRVTAAQPATNFSRLDPAPGLAAARQWTFRPQRFDGHPVQAVGIVAINYASPEIAADPDISFPDTQGRDVEIVLERGACFGTCPDYRVSIDGDGRVRFSTAESNFPGMAAQVHRRFNGTNVLWPGTHEAQISPVAVAELVGKFRAAHFMGLKPEYAAGITDNPTYALTLRVGKTTKRVTDYVGRAVGMPASVTALEEAVDRMAGTQRWVRGNAETVALLEAEGFDFRSNAAADLIQAALVMNDDASDQPTVTQMIVAALAQGLDLEATAVAMRPGGAKRSEPLGAVIAASAARYGNTALFNEMARRGYVARMSKGMLDATFTGEMGCSPDTAKALAAAGANPKARGSDGNALHALRRSYGSCSKVPPDQRAEMARTLIALGVPLEARDDLGWTVLMGCDDPEVARLLLAAGANMNARAPDGTTPLLSIDDDRVAILLLRAGADPRARGKDRSLRDQAREHHWPATLAWLDAHGAR
jgi:hypothetical protein